ncbi:hypothetical protein FRUB_03068 [Fimbriiglobus ruber]|uniref:Uncharacterized protein n=1 Tax=Fimbriiglobus ruber TaxID=1908690 RepID=A0A225E1W3_9BACT|nr:hypothetical protein FRUB_03068 [Fimbriiglobus ruber]
MTAAAERAVRISVPAGGARGFPAPAVAGCTVSHSGSPKARRIRTLFEDGATEGLASKL